MSQPRNPKLPPGWFRAGGESVYTLDVVVRLTGIDTERSCITRSMADPAGRRPRARARRFDDETLRTLQRIEHLRAHYAMACAG